MKAYWSLFIARFALLLQYRAAALAGIATQLFWGFLKVMVLEAFFTHTTSAQPMTFRETVGYTWLGQAFLIALVPWSGDREIQELIRSGAVGTAGTNGNLFMSVSKLKAPCLVLTSVVIIY
jgi:ABC-2 type transport system permease protein